MAGRISVFRARASRRRWLAACAALIGVGALLPPLAATAQQVRPGEPEPGVTVLELGKDPALQSLQFVAIEDVAGSGGVRFAVGGLSILQPVIVTLVAADSAQDLRIEIFKKGWDTPRRVANTGSAGITEIAFRTEGGLNIRVTGPAQAAKFALAVVAGPEMRPPMKDVFVPARAGGAATGGRP